MFQYNCFVSILTIQEYLISCVYIFNIYIYHNFLRYPVLDSVKYILK